MLIMRDGYMDMMFMHLSMDMYERISNANIFNNRYDDIANAK